jgi:hypothetical protein
LRRISLGRWSAAVALALTTRLPAAQQASIELTDHALAGELNRLAEVYEGLVSASVTRVNTTEPDVHSEAVVLSTGAFVVTFWKAQPEAEPELFNVTHWDGKVLRSTHGPPRYVEGEPAAGFSDPPGPVHHWDAPWPMLHEWCLALANDPEALGFHGGSRLRVESESLGVALTFGPQDECLEVDVVRDGVRTRMTFSDFVAVGRWKAPREQERAFYTRGSGSGEARVDQWSLVEVRFNDEDANGALVWDPDDLGVYRYSPSTRNVYSSDGTVLYNEEEWARRVLGGTKVAGVVRRLLVPGLVILAVASGALAYWRLRR